jgi:hypothetical protein
MNKTNSSKITHKTQHPMRYLFKMRNNHHATIQTFDSGLQASHSINKPNPINLHDDA